MRNIAKQQKEIHELGDSLVRWIGTKCNSIIYPIKKLVCDERIINCQNYSCLVSHMLALSVDKYKSNGRQNNWVQTNCLQIKLCQCHKILSLNISIPPQYLIYITR